MKKIIISIVISLASVLSYAQTTNLHLLPKQQRDSILYSIAKQTVLQYGAPEYYTTPHTEVIRDFGIIKPLGCNDYVRTYGVFYLYDPNEIVMEYHFLAYVAINAEAGTAVSITFGCGWGFGLEGNTDHNKMPFKSSWEGDRLIPPSSMPEELMQEKLQKQQVLIQQAAEYEASDGEKPKKKF